MRAVPAVWTRDSDGFPGPMRSSMGLSLFSPAMGLGSGIIEIEYPRTPASDSAYTVATRAPTIVSARWARAASFVSSRGGTSGGKPNTVDESVSPKTDASVGVYSGRPATAETTRGEEEPHPATVPAPSTYMRMTRRIAQATSLVDNGGRRRRRARELSASFPPAEGRGKGDPRRGGAFGSIIWGGAPSKC